MIELTLFYIADTTRIQPRILDQALALLDQTEQSRYSNFKAEEARKNFLLGRLLAKTALAQSLKQEAGELLFAISENGKPFLENKQAFFSIAHCQGAVLVAVSSQAVGVDIEQQSRFYSEKIVNEQFFSRQLLKSIQLAENQARRAAQYWTAIESLVILKDSSIFPERKAFHHLVQSNMTYPNKDDTVFISWKFSDTLVASFALWGSGQQPLNVNYIDFLNKANQNFMLLGITEGQSLSVNNKRITLGGDI